MSDVLTSEYYNIIKNNISILDVRSQAEFLKSHMPNSQNIPILNDEHRAIVGTTYKKLGQSEAIKLGHTLVSGDYKQGLIQSWVNVCKKSETKVMCWRGGLRSKLAEEWLGLAGVKTTRISGGYKQFRRFLIEEAQKKIINNNALIVTGLTGVGKTSLISELEGFFISIDLERLASHKGSAFGGIFKEQPTQAQFENDLNWQLVKNIQDNKRILFEDESRMIGSIVLPEFIFEKIRNAPVIVLEENMETRIKNIYNEYILESGLVSDNVDLRVATINKFRKAFFKISKKLGGERYQKCIDLFQMGLLDLDSKSVYSSHHREWIKILLLEYYDKQYLKSFEKRNPKVLLRGNKSEILAGLVNIK